MTEINPEDSNLRGFMRISYLIACKFCLLFLLNSNLLVDVQNVDLLQRFAKISFYSSTLRNIWRYAHTIIARLLSLY